MEALILLVILVVYLLIVIKNKKEGEPLFPVDGEEKYNKMMEPFKETLIVVALIVIIYAYFTDQL